VTDFAINLWVLLPPGLLVSSGRNRP